MNLIEQKRALATAAAAARAAGALMRRNLRSAKVINEAHQFDIKLELDVRCQKLIERHLLRAFPEIAILGEEGITGNRQSRRRWVVDPIDGTVNFTYGIPHCCVSIALQEESPRAARRKLEMSKAWHGHPDAGYETIAGVVYDPFADELWTATQKGPALLNGRPVRASRRTELGEAIVSMGFAKNRETLRVGLPRFNRIIRRVRKVRMMGAAALGMVYVAGGRFDAYLEYGIKLWDIAAGGLILERAGGEFWYEPADDLHNFNLKANNGRIRAKLERLR